MRNIVWIMLAVVVSCQNANSAQISSSQRAASVEWQSVKVENAGGRVDWYKGEWHDLIAFDAVTDPAQSNTDVFIMDRELNNFPIWDGRIVPLR